MKLFIIGNGFDLYTGYHTKYSDFKNFLIENEYHYRISDYTLLDILCAEEDYDLWKDFEEGLASISLDSISYGYEPNEESYVNRHVIDHMQYIHEELYELIGLAFSDFIAQKTEAALPQKTLYSALFSLYDKFVTFNYSPTLENIYRISPAKIFYIHGRCISERDEEEDIRSPIVFGHSGEIPYELYERNMYYEDDHPELIKSRIRASLQKQLDIYHFEEYIGHVTDYEEIQIIGHSLGKVDKPYFQKLDIRYGPQIIYWEYIINRANYNRSESINKIRNLFTRVNWTINFYDNEGIFDTESSENNITQ